MNKRKILAYAGFLLSLTSASVLAGDAEAGKAKSAVCAACHGANGISSIDLYPNLAGQKKGYLVKQMKAFKNGERKDPTMTAMMMPLTDTDIENLATYYSNLK